MQEIHYFALNLSNISSNGNYCAILQDPNNIAIYYILPTIKVKYRIQDVAEEEQARQYGTKKEANMTGSIQSTIERLG